MKMPASEYAQLREDFRIVADAIQRTNGPFNFSTVRGMWAVYHRIMDDRSFDDSHPFYSGEQPRRRILPFHSKDYNSRFYAMGLNDSHIETALRRIVAE